MRRAPAFVIALFMVVISLVVLVVAWAGHARGDRLEALEASNAQMRIELDQAKRDVAAARRETQAANTRAAAAEARADRLQARVDALEAALRRQGVDPGTVVVVQSNPAPRASSSPAPRASASAAASASPSPSPTCRVTLPVVGCRGR